MFIPYGGLGSQAARGWLSPYQQVLRLDVTVDDVQAVQVFDGAGQVVQHPAGVPLGVFAGGSDGVEKVSTLEESSWLSRILTDGSIGCPRRGRTNQKGGEERTRMRGFLRAFSLLLLCERLSGDFSPRYGRLVTFYPKLKKTCDESLTADTWLLHSSSPGKRS